jgi:hypothetical protein
MAPQNKIARHPEQFSWIPATLPDRSIYFT